MDLSFMTFDLPRKMRFALASENDARGFFYRLSLITTGSRRLDGTAALPPPGKPNAVPICALGTIRYRMLKQQRLSVKSVGTHRCILDLTKGNIEFLI